MKKKKILTNLDPDPEWLSVHLKSSYMKPGASQDLSFEPSIIVLLL